MRTAGSLLHPVLYFVSFPSSAEQKPLENVEEQAWCVEAGHSTGLCKWKKGRGLAYQMQDIEEEVSDLESLCPGRCATLVPLVMHGCERPLEWVSTAPQGIPASHLLCVGVQNAKPQIRCWELIHPAVTCLFCSPGPALSPGYRGRERRGVCLWDCACGLKWPEAALSSAHGWETDWCYLPTSSASVPALHVGQAQCAPLSTPAPLLPRRRRSCCQHRFPHAAPIAATPC